MISLSSNLPITPLNALLFRFRSPVMINLIKAPKLFWVPRWMDPSWLFVLLKGGLMAWIAFAKDPWSSHIILHNSLSIILAVKLSTLSFDILLEDAPNLNILLHPSFILLTCLSSKLGMSEAVFFIYKNGLQPPMIHGILLIPQWILVEFWVPFQDYTSSLKFMAALVPSSLPQHRHNYGKVSLYFL